MAPRSEINLCIGLDTVDARRPRRPTTIPRDVPRPPPCVMQALHSENEGRVADVIFPSQRRSLGWVAKEFRSLGVQNSGIVPEEHTISFWNIQEEMVEEFKETK